MRWDNDAKDGNPESGIGRGYNPEIWEITGQEFRIPNAKPDTIARSTIESKNEVADPADTNKLGISSEFSVAVSEWGFFSPGIRGDIEAARVSAGGEHIRIARCMESRRCSRDKVSAACIDGDGSNEGESSSSSSALGGGSN